MQVNNNGIISFNTSYVYYNPTPFPVSGTNVLAPYWADFDTRPHEGGTVFYRETTNSTLLKRASVDVQNAFASTFFATHLFIATWNATGYYSLNTNEVCLQHFVISVHQ